jgi:hypothetical protein
MAVRDGRVDEALARHVKYFPELKRDPIANWSGAVDYAWLLQIAGDTQRADKILDQCMDLVRTRPRLGNHGFAIMDVHIYALQGRKAEALLALREAVDEGWRKSWPFFLKYDPVLESLHMSLSIERSSPNLRRIWQPNCNGCARCKLRASWSRFKGFTGLKKDGPTIEYTYDDWRQVGRWELPFVILIDDGERNFRYQFDDIRPDAREIELFIGK